MIGYHTTGPGTSRTSRTTRTRLVRLVRLVRHTISHTGISSLERTLMDGATPLPPVTKGVGGTAISVLPFTSSRTGLCKVPPPVVLGKPARSCLVYADARVAIVMTSQVRGPSASASAPRSTARSASLPWWRATLRSCLGQRRSPRCRRRTRCSTQGRTATQRATWSVQTERQNQPNPKQIQSRSKHNPAGIIHLTFVKCNQRAAAAAAQTWKLVRKTDGCTTTCELGRTLTGVAISNLFLPRLGHNCR